MKIKDNENVKINNYNNKKENVKIIIIIKNNYRKSN